MELDKKSIIRLGDILTLEEWYNKWRAFALSVFGIQTKPFQKSRYFGAKEIGSDAFFSDDINELPSDCAMIAEKYEPEGCYLVIKIYDKEIRAENECSLS